jgi:hypothetical protein
MPAVIRISAKRELLEEAVSRFEFGFEEAHACRRKRRLDPEGVQPTTTYNLTVSEADGDRVPQQIADVEQFLDSHGKRIGEFMRAIEGRGRVDFSWDFPRDASGQFNRFPHCLLKQLVELNLELEILVYGTEARERP